MTIRRKWVDDDPRWEYRHYRAKFEAEYAARSGFDVERFLDDIEAIAKAVIADQAFDLIKSKSVM